MEDGARKHQQAQRDVDGGNIVAGYVRRRQWHNCEFARDRLWLPSHQRKFALQQNYTGRCTQKLSPIAHKSLAFGCNAARSKVGRRLARGHGALHGSSAPRFGVQPSFLPRLWFGRYGSTELIRVLRELLHFLFE